MLSMFQVKDDDDGGNGDDMLREKTCDYNVLLGENSLSKSPPTM